MAAVKTLSGDRDIAFAVKLQFLRHDAVVALTVFAGEYLVGDGVGDIADAVGNQRGFKCFFSGRQLKLFLPRKSALHCLVLRKRETLLRNTLVIAEWGKCCREKLTKAVRIPLLVDIWHLLHLLFDLGEKRFVFLLGILLVQNAILRFFEAAAAEKIF